mmetsp:Transcript_15713/g.23822  ORF Transcript_15713/g.23822 Transcript_15713/m.23822 type:complete len:275 (-) Transcript_15713:558-1382(-)
MHYDLLKNLFLLNLKKPPITSFAILVTIITLLHIRLHLGTPLRQPTRQQHLMNHTIWNCNHPPAIILINNDIHGIPVDELPTQNAIRPPRIPRLDVNIQIPRGIELLLRIEYARIAEGRRQNQIVPRQNLQRLLHLLLLQRLGNGLAHHAQRLGIHGMREHPIPRLLRPRLVEPARFPLLLHLHHPLLATPRLARREFLPGGLVVLLGHVRLEYFVLGVLVVLLVIQQLVLLGEHLVLGARLRILVDVAGDVGFVGVHHPHLGTVHVRNHVWER